MRAALAATLMLTTALTLACSSWTPHAAQTETKTETVTVTTTAEAATSVSPTISRPAVGIGEEADDGALAFTVTEVRPITPQGWLALYLTIRNIGDRAQSYAAENQQLIDVGGREFNVDINALEDSHNPLAVVQADVNPGIELKAVLTFKVPSDIKPARLVLHASTGSPGAVVNLS